MANFNTVDRLLAGMVSVEGVVVMKSLTSGPLTLTSLYSMLIGLVLTGAEVFSKKLMVSVSGKMRSKGWALVSKKTYPDEGSSAPKSSWLGLSCSHDIMPKTPINAANK